MSKSQIGICVVVGKEIEEIKKTMTAGPCQNNSVWLGGEIVNLFLLLLYNKNTNVTCSVRAQG